MLAGPSPASLRPAFMPETVVMVATSYPRFPGDTVGTFMEPIAHGVAARGHDVHLVLPWHPRFARGQREGGVTFHPFRYAPHPSLNVFGYAGALEADVRLRWTAVAAAPLALALGIRAARRVARDVRATVMHGHWVIPGGAMAAAASGGRPLVVSLHGSDVYVAERHAVAGRVAEATFHRAGWVTACSADLRTRAIELGASAEHSEVVPYGVDGTRFAPSREARNAVRRALGVGDETPLVFAAGRFVRKKGFEFLIDAIAPLASRWPEVTVILGGDGDLRSEYEARARAAGVANRLRLVGTLSQDDVARHLAAADVAVVPSVRDGSGNVDGLPNVVMEALASATPLVATGAGGIGAVVEDGVTGVRVPEGDPRALADAIGGLIGDPHRGRAIGERARQRALTEHGWAKVAQRFEAAYARARLLARR
jgi:glycosyltransferase involved in cell wall biosynthesis